MTAPSTARSRRARIRRTSAAVLLASGLSLSATAVASAQSPSPTAAPQPAAPNVVGLKKGAYGEAVKALQEALVRVGIGVKYGVDSYFGSATEASVKAFQRYKGLPITGVVDQATAAALGTRRSSGCAGRRSGRGRQRHARPGGDRSAGQAAAAGA